MSIEVQRAAWAFSLIELIGVLAILAILTSVMLPTVINRIDQAYQEKEREDLAAVGIALKQRILRTRSIPRDEWAQFAADELGVPLERIIHSATGHPRVLVVDPKVGAEPGTVQLPYTQTDTGITGHTGNLRMMIVSSHRLSLPDLHDTDSKAFDELWNVPTGQVPQSWPATWKNHGDRLFIFRLDLSLLMCQLILNNLSPDHVACISVDDHGCFAIPGRWNASYFKGTVIGLFDGDRLVARDVLWESRSYVSEHGIWRGALRDGKSTGSEFVTALEAFSGSPLNRAAPSSIDQTSVIAAYRQFALTYASWAHAGFPGIDSPEYQSVSAARNHLQQATSSMIAQ
jgi:type II secretory pathway pseudopilin PulG